jgi:uncharacterized DUF497 family protein
MTTWYEQKRKSNIAKHGVDFALVAGFDWDNAVLDEEDGEAYGERRERATGLIGTKLYVYIYTLRGEEDRAISLRLANKAEKRRYVREVEHNPHRSRTGRDQKEAR